MAKEARVRDHGAAAMAKPRRAEGAKELAGSALARSAQRGFTGQKQAGGRKSADREVAITFYSGLRFWNFLAHRDRRDVIYNAAPMVYLKAFIASPPPGSRA